jgi:hypothetical protein
MIPSKLELKTDRGAMELDADRCLINDVQFTDEYNPHRVRPWVIGNEYGPLVLVWASSGQDAFDAACDADILAGLAIDEEYYRERCNEACQEARCGDEHSCETPDGVMLLGNASEPFDSTYAWVTEVQLTPLQERYFAEARGAGADTLGRI